MIEHPKAGELVRSHELEVAALDRLRAFVAGDAELWCELRAIVRAAVPAEKIIGVAEKEQVDLIVLGVRKAKGLMRTTHLPVAVAHHVISHAACPGTDRSRVRPIHGTKL